MPPPKWCQNIKQASSSSSHQHQQQQQQHQLVPPSQTSPWYHAANELASPSPSLSTAAPNVPQHLYLHHQSSTDLRLPSSAPSRGLGSMRRARRAEDDVDSNSSYDSSSNSPRLLQQQHLDRSNSLPLLKRSRSNPFLQKPLHLSRESLPLLLGSRQQQQFGSMLSMQSNLNSERGGDDAPAQTKELHSPPVITHGHVERHLSLIDLIAVGVGGTLGTGFFLLCSLLSSSYAGPASIFCWLVSAIPALLSGFCFAELAGQIPAAGSTYAYVYASMGELPATVAAGCLSLEYLVSAGAVARGWGDNMVEWILTKPGVDNDGWMAHILQPGWNFNPLAFVLSALVAMLLLGGVKESKNVTNYFTVLKMMGIVIITLTGFSLLDVRNLIPLLPPTLGANGFFRGSTVSFMGYLGFDEVCCLTAEAMDPQKNMPRAIMWTIAILTVSYMAGTLALSGMLPYDQINSVSGFRDAFEARDVEWASTMASLGELVFLPLVVLVALMAQPRLTFALACDGLMPSWFGQVDDSGNMLNGTLFAGVLMTIIASFVRLQYLNDFISAGVLVAFSMTNSSLVLLRYESPDDSPGLLEKLLLGFNAICFVSSLLLTHTCTSTIGRIITVLSCLSALMTCILIKLWCPAASYFGGKTRRATTQHITVGIVSVDEEYFRTPFVPYLPCLGMAVNWYLIAQLPWNDLAFLTMFLGCAVIFYFSFGHFYSVGNNGGWDAYESCGLSIAMTSEVVGVVDDSVHGLPIDDCGEKNSINKDQG